MWENSDRDSAWVPPSTIADDDRRARRTAPPSPPAGSTPRPRTTVHGDQAPSTTRFAPYVRRAGRAAARRRTRRTARPGSPRSDDCARARAPRPVRRRQRDDGLDAVVEEQVGHQEHQRVRVAAQLAQRRGRAARKPPPRPDRGLGARWRAPPVAQPPQRDEREQRPPQARRGRLIRAALPSVRPSESRDEVEHEVQREQQPAAEVAERPAPGGDRVALVRARRSRAGTSCRRRVRQPNATLASMNSAPPSR